MKKCSIFLILLLVNRFYSQVSFTVNPNVCSGATHTLTANTGTDVALSYAWAIAPSAPVFSSPNASLTTFTIPASGIYTISLNVTLTSGFSSYSSTVNVTQTPTITIAQSATTVCMVKNQPGYSQAQPVTFTASGGSGSGSCYIWNPMITQVGDCSKGIASVSFPVCYTVSIAAGSCIGKAVACISITPRYSITVSPSSATLCSSDSLHLNVTGVSSLAVLPIQKYKWYDPLPVSIANSSVNPASISPSVTSTYTVETFDDKGCVSLPALITVSVVSCTGIHSNSIDESMVSVYPNPANEVLNIYCGTLASTGSATFKIVNNLGQVVKEEEITFTENNITISTKELVSAVYILNLKIANSQTISKRFVIAK